jgi:hypothetical protein
MVITLRHGPDDGRGGYPVSLIKVEDLARAQGLLILRSIPSPDLRARPGLSWTNVVLRVARHH